MKDFAGRLKFFRSQRGLSQAALGELVGKKATTVSTWERGESEPGLDEIAALASHLGVSPERLAYGDSVHKATASPLRHYRDSGSREAPPIGVEEERTPPMVDPRFQPRSDPTPQMCLDHFQRFLALAAEQPGGVGYTWHQLQKHFPLDEFEERKPLPQ